MEQATRDDLAVQIQEAVSMRFEGGMSSLDSMARELTNRWGPDVRVWFTANGDLQVRCRSKQEAVDLASCLVRGTLNGASLVGVSRAGESCGGMPKSKGEPCHQPISRVTVRDEKHGCDVDLKPVNKRR